MSGEHCKECCCARSWQALGITEYTKMSIAEHIDALRAECETLRAPLERFVDHYQCGVNPMLDSAWSLARAALARKGLSYE